MTFDYKDLREVFIELRLWYLRSLEEVADKLYDLGFSGIKNGSLFFKDAIKYYNLLKEEIKNGTNIEADPYYAKVLNKIGFSYLWLSINYETRDIYI